jgi:hypothetical protein
MALLLSADRTIEELKTELKSVKMKPSANGNFIFDCEKMKMRSS